MMRVKLKLKPGVRGTKKLVAEYGDKLICVRYRYDEKRRRRLKTVETIIEDVPRRSYPANSAKVCVKTDVSEKELHQRIRNAGGRWEKHKKVWKMSYADTKKPGLEKRIAEDE